MPFTQDPIPWGQVCTDPLAGGIRLLFQPIVELRTRRAVAVELLSRGPVGSAVERPGPLFGAARAAGMLSELGWACRLAALRAAHGSRLTIFLNLEPASCDLADRIREQVEAASQGLDVVAEVPVADGADTTAADATAAHDWAHSVGWRSALDDLGATPASVELVEVAPWDIVKLDISLLRSPDELHRQRVVRALRHHAHPATVVAEGIESEEHERQALALGATLGQGFLYGLPSVDLPASS